MLHDFDTLVHLLGATLEVQSGLLLVRVHIGRFANEGGTRLPAKTEPIKHTVQACSTGSQLHVQSTAVETPDLCCSSFWVSRAHPQGISAAFITAYTLIFLPLTTKAPFLLETCKARQRACNTEVNNTRVHHELARQEARDAPPLQSARGWSHT